MAFSSKSSSTIMFTDIVGYSALVSRDEKRAMELLAMHDKIIEPIIQQYSGIIIKKIGDSIFAQFNNPAEGIQTAISIQKKLKTRNSISESQNKFQIRIGLHIGNVIEKDGDLFGHDVNLCSRIESIAPRGGISASRAIVQCLGNSHQLYFREMGYVKLKNIPDPQPIYKIYLNSQDFESESPKKLKKSLLENGVKIVNIDSYEVKETFSISVSYINNLGKDDDETIAYNLTEHLLNDLELINSVRTPNFNDILDYKDSTFKITDLARKMEVENILRGSILRDDNSLHLSFDLTDIISGKVLWEKKWTELITNEKIIRKEIIQAILRQFNLQLPKQLTEIYSDKITHSSRALEIYYQAKYYSDNIQSRSNLIKGQKLLESAIQIDKNFVVAYALNALILLRIGEYGAAETNLEIGKEIALDKNDFQGLASIYNIFHILYFTHGKYQKACKNIEKALEYQIQLNNKLKLAKYRANYAQSLNQLKEIDQAIEQNKLSIQLKEELEENKSLGTSYGVLANTYFSKGDFSLAFENGIKSLAMCRSNNMINFEGRLSVIVADILLQLGKYSKMMEYVKLAESILTDFDEPFLMGKLEFMKSHNCLNKGNVESAFRHIDSCIDLFDVAEQRPFLIEAYIHKIEILIEKNEFSLAKRVISKIELLNKKLQDAPERPLLEIFKLLHSPDKIERDNIRQIQKQISTTIPAEQILCYWHLTNIFKKIGELKAAENCLTKALELINQQALINSKVEDQNSYRNQVNLHKNIKEKLRIFQGRALA